MDMKKETKTPKHGAVPNLTNANVVVGAKQLKKAVRNDRVRCVFLARNADPALTEPLEELCRQHHIPITWVASMTDLGRACGIEVGAAAAAILNGSNG
jgi:large subunit ribosomal protein L7A